MMTKEGAGESLVFFTKRGMVKRTLSAEYGARKGKVAGISLKKGDELLDVLPFEAENNLLLITRKAMSLRMDAAEIPVNGRATSGVKGMGVELDDELAFASFVPEAGEMVLLTDRGYAKRCLLVDFEVQKRGGKGVKCFAFNKNGANASALVCARPVTEPYTLEVVQADKTVTPISTEEIMIENKTGRGKPYIVALMDNVVLRCYKKEE